MKREILLAVLAVTALFLGLSQKANAQFCGVGCYETGEISCEAPTCGAPDCGGIAYYGDDGCGPACDLCYGGDCCGCFGSLLSGVASVVMAPIHWIASLFSCGTFADCGCAPPYEECYSNPCDICGNYVGDGTCGNPYYGYRGYYAATNQSAPSAQPEQMYADTVSQQNQPYAEAKMNQPYAAPRGTAQRPNPSLYDSNEPIAEKSDYVRYDRVETIGQKKIRREARQAQLKSQQNQAQVTRGYRYNEQVLNEAASSMNMNQPMAAPASRQVRRIASAPASQPRPSRAYRY